MAFSFEDLALDAQRVSALLSKHRLRLVEMRADGNCQFRALASFFRSSSVDHVVMRRLVCKYILEHQEQFQADIVVEYGCSVPRYCQVMGRDACWGDAITLQAFGLLFHINVWLIMPDGVTKLTEEPRWHNIALVRKHNHYDAASPMVQ
jgi:hypothetical protein